MSALPFASPPMPLLPLPVPPTPDHAVAVDAAFDDAAVSRALLHGLVTHDPASARLSLATVRALRRSERGHVDRVVAVVRACTESVRRGESPESVRRHLDDLAPFERAAVLRLLDAHHTTPVHASLHAAGGATPEAPADVGRVCVSERTAALRRR